MLQSGGPLKRMGFWGQYEPLCSWGLMAILHDYRLYVLLIDPPCSLGLGRSQNNCDGYTVYCMPECTKVNSKT